MKRAVRLYGRPPTPKARSLLDGILALPKQAVAAVEHQTRPALTKDATA
ncbi:hypothetical protein ACFW6R_25715 [Streptomyces albidoflavus]